MLKVSIRQVKAARALLAWSQTDLAKASGISEPTIKRLEATDGDVGGRAGTGAAIRAALEAAGVMFVEENGEGPGVRLRKKHKTPADVTHAMAEKTEEFLNREEAVAQANVRAIEKEVEKHASGESRDAVQGDIARALAEKKLDKRLAQVDVPPEEKERRKAALTKPPRRGPK